MAEPGFQHRTSDSESLLLTTTRDRTISRDRDHFRNGLCSIGNKGDERKRKLAGLGGRGARRLGSKERPEEMLLICTTTYMTRSRWPGQDLGAVNSKPPLRWELARLPERQKGECGGCTVRVTVSGRRWQRWRGWQRQVTLWGLEGSGRFVFSAHLSFLYLSVLASLLLPQTATSAVAPLLPEQSGSVCPLP